MKIKTTHVGSLPRPKEMHTQYLKQKKISDDDLRHYLTVIMERQIVLGLSFINNGELPRSDYIHATINRIAGFGDTGTAPFPQDLEDLPEYSRRFSGRNGLITLNPKAPVKLPASSEELVYTGQVSLRKELDMMVGVFNDLKQKYPESNSELFFTAPSPGTVALFLENKYYPNYEAYLRKLGEMLKREYEIINSYGILLQIDCPDLAMGRHTRFKDLPDENFLTLIDSNVEILNQALENIDPKNCRAHICWGNYPGTHHRDIDLRIVQHTPGGDANTGAVAGNTGCQHFWNQMAPAIFFLVIVLPGGVIRFGLLPDDLNRTNLRMNNAVILVRGFNANFVITGGNTGKVP